MGRIGEPDSISLVGALPAGTNLLGKVGIDQTTPGTTNAIDVKTIAGVTPRLDGTDKLAVALYGKSWSAGDTPVGVSDGGLLKVAAWQGWAVPDGGANDAAYCLGITGSNWPMLIYEMIFNGATWDRQRNNEAITVLASAARTATVSSADFVNYNGKGLTLFINVSAAVDTPSVVFTIEGKDPISGFYWTLLSLAAVTGVLTRCAWIYPGITPVASQAAALNLPRTWRVTATHGDADSITYSVAAVVNCN